MKIIKNALSKIFLIEDGTDHHWQWYKDFFSLNYIRYFATWFAAAPIFANIFGIAGTNTPICISEKCISIQMDLPFSWWILWIGSVAFVIAFGLYHSFCPPFIKRYSSYSDYLAASHSPRYAAWEAKYLVEDALSNPKSYDLKKFVDRMSTKEFISVEGKGPTKPEIIVEEHQTVLRFSFQNSFYKLGMPPVTPTTVLQEKQNEKAVYEVVWEIFGRRASSFKKIRFTITYLIRIAWLTVILTIGQNILSVASYVF